MIGDSATTFGNAVGHFHPALVHFPIALLLVGAALEFQQVVRRVPVRSEFARQLLLLGTLVALAAVVSGLRLFHAEDFRERTFDAIRLHRVLGLSTLTAAVLASLVGGLGSGRGPVGTRLVLYALIYGPTAERVGLAGHYGGWVVFGWGSVWTP